jgi:glutamate synthase domain-containing protein 3
MTKLSVRRAARVIAVSEATRQDIIRLYDADPARINGGSVRWSGLQGEAAERELHDLLVAHAAEGSACAAAILESWTTERQRFLVVEPASAPVEMIEEEVATPAAASAGR